MSNKMTPESEKNFQEKVKVMAKGLYFLDGSRMYYSGLSAPYFYTYLHQVFETFSQSQYKDIFCAGGLNLPQPPQIENKDLIVFLFKEELFPWLDSLDKMAATKWINSFCNDLIFQMKLLLADINFRPKSETAASSPTTTTEPIQQSNSSTINANNNLFGNKKSKTILN